MINLLMRGLRIGAVAAGAFLVLAVTVPDCLFCQGIGMHAAAAASQQPVCTAGILTCTNDTANDRALQNAVNDTTVQARIFNIWMGQCQNIYSEATSTNDHSDRVKFCQSMAAGNVSKSTLVSAVLYVGGTIGATIQTELLCSQGTTNDGCLVDADIVTAIGTIMTVTGTSPNFYGLATRAWP